MILFVIGDQQIADFKDQITRSAIADHQPVSGAEPIEHRYAHSKKGYPQA
jgi:hypothetical protein